MFLARIESLMAADRVSFRKDGWLRVLVVREGEVVVVWEEGVVVVEWEEEEVVVVWEEEEV